jgi:peptide/nickel transport system substrate-binding protein
VSYDTPDPYTLVVHLKKFDASFLLTMAETGIGQIASPTAMAKPTTPDNAGKDHCIGTGPFKFDSWEKDQYIRFVKWGGYWQPGKPYVDAIEIRNNADLTVSIMSFKAGEVNMVENIDPSDYVALGKAGYDVNIPPLAFVFSIDADSNNPDSPFAKQEVREALDYAIDKEGMAQGIGLGTQFPAYQCASPADGWYIKDYQPRKYDPEKAKQLLKDAGYPNGFTCNLLTDVRARMDQVLAVQGYLEAVGIHTTLDKADVPRMTDWQVNGWQGLLIPGFPNWSSFMSWANRFASTTITFPSQAVPDGWAQEWAAIKSEVDQAKRMQMMQTALKKLYDGAYITTYIYDGPRYVTDGTIMDMQWDSHHINGYFAAQDVWLQKK